MPISFPVANSFVPSEVIALHCTRQSFETFACIVNSFNPHGDTESRVSQTGLHAALAQLP